MTDRAFRRGDPRSAGTRIIYALIVGAVAWLLAPYAGVPRALIAGDVAGAVQLAVSIWIIVSSDAPETARRAASVDPGRTVVWFIVLAVCAATMASATFVLHSAKHLAEKDLVLVLVIAATAIAWALTHAAFTLRYAHLYYRDPKDLGGLEFPHEDDDKDPDDLDFAYFAFTIGMCFQVSDVQVSDRRMRRTVLAHSLISFAFNTGIIALVINVVVSQVS